MNNKRAALEWLNTPEDEKQLKYTEGQNDHYALYWAEQGEKLRKKAQKMQTSGKIKRIFTRWHRKLCRPKPIKWRNEYGSIYPFCPACDEYAYDKKRCVFCGQPFITEDTESGGKT